jgi:hypothetical protein
MRRPRVVWVSSEKHAGVVCAYMWCRNWFAGSKITSASVLRQKPNRGGAVPQRDGRKRCRSIEGCGCGWQEARSQQDSLLGQKLEQNSLLEQTLEQNILNHMAQTL